MSLTGSYKYKTVEMLELPIYFLLLRISYTLMIFSIAGIFTGQTTKKRTRHPKKGCAWTLALGKFVKKGKGKATNSTTGRS